MLQLVNNPFCVYKCMNNELSIFYCDHLANLIQLFNLLLYKKFGFYPLLLF